MALLRFKTDISCSNHYMRR